MFGQPSQWGLTDQSTWVDASPRSTLKHGLPSDARPAVAPTWGGTLQLQGGGAAGRRQRPRWASEGLDKSSTLAARAEADAKRVQSILDNAHKELLMSNNDFENVTPAPPTHKSLATQPIASRLVWGAPLIAL